MKKNCKRQMKQILVLKKEERKKVSLFNSWMDKKDTIK